MPNTQPDREYIALQSVRFIARYKVLELDLILGTPSGEVNGVLADDLSCVAARRIAAAMNAFEEPPTVEIGPPPDFGFDAGFDAGFDEDGRPEYSGFGDMVGA